jgi:HAE1 family hydrophobic/amphiphilic exporter-1
MMIFVAVIVFGIYSLIKLPVDLYPEINPPFISIMTTYPGANAAEIETNVTKLIEDRMGSVDKLKEIISSSYDNMSVVTLEFEWDADLDEAVSDVRNSLDWVLSSLPDNVDRPSVFKFSTSMMPIIFYAITADASYSGLDRIFDERIVNPLNRIDGIGSVSLSGTPKRVVYIDIDQTKLDAYRLTIEQIGNVVAAENLNLPSGSVKMGKDDYQLRVEGEFDESTEIPDLVIGSYAGKNIYIRDVASVRDTIKDVSIDERINGKQGMRMMVSKQSGANTVRIANQVRAELEKLKKELPPDITIQEIFDSSTFIKQAVNNLSETLMYALIFVVLVILFFLGRWRATLIIALTIPISLIVAFIYLGLTGNSLNIISLSSISIAIGMVVDDAIVVLENIMKHVERGNSPRESSIYATNEVWLSVIVTTLVVVAVFMPLTMVSGMMGVMFRQLGWIVTITVVASTCAAISITPMLSSRVLKLKDPNRKRSRINYDNTIGKLLDGFDSFYERTLRWSLLHKKIVLPAILIIFVASCMLLKYVETDYMPQTDESRLSAMIELQTGTRVEETMKTARSVEQLVKENYPEVILVSTSSGADSEGNISSLFNASGTNIINMSVRLKPISERSRSVFLIADDLRAKLKQYPEIINSSVTTESGGGMSGGNNVAIEIFGYDFDRTNRLAEEIKIKVDSIKGAANVQVSRKKDRPELKITVDREKLAQHGLSNATVASFVRNRVDGMVASKLREEGREFDIIVRLDENSRNSITKLEDMTMTTPQGKQIKLKELASVGEYWSPPNIDHKRKERIVTVSVMPSAGVALGTLAADISKALATVDVPRDIMVNVGGAFEDQQESFMDLGLLLLLSLLLVFIVMAAQFESFKNPFVIMFAIPFAFSGSFLALYLTNTSLNLIAALGMVLLVGVVVKNGIVLVDFTNLMRDRGYKLYDAIALSGRSRLRPVLMTSATTILGMLPMALSSSEGSEIWSPMGISVIGGLVFSTVITLIIVPVMYAILSRSGERDKQEKIRKRFHFMEGRKDE